MKTIIKVENKELFEFNNSRNFTLGEEVQCYGEPHIVTSIERRKLNVRDKEETIVTIEKKEIYNGIRVSSKDFKTYGIAVPKGSSIDSVTIGVKNAPTATSSIFNRNPFETIRGY